MGSPVYKTSVSVDKGHVRANNEDNIFFNGVYLTPDNRDDGLNLNEITDKELLVYAVFDGMGGTDYGEEASYIASEVTSQFYPMLKGLSFDELDKHITDMILNANARIYNRTLEIGSGRMGATVAMVVIYKGIARVYNVGDSRVYLWRDGALKQISLDDSFAQRLFRMGIITYEEALVHKDRNKLVQHLGIGEKELHIEPHISENIYLKNGDRILVCSDGLTDMVSNEGISAIIANGDVSDCAETLVCKALENGGRDNISVILIEPSISETVYNEPVYVNAESSVQKKSKNKSGLVIMTIAILITFAILAAVVALKFLPDFGRKNIPSNESSHNTEDINRNVYQSQIIIEPEEEKDITSIVSSAGFSPESTYTSGDEKIVAVSDKGVITGVNVGTSYIIVKDGNNELQIDITVATNGNAVEHRSSIDIFYSSALKTIQNNNKND